MLKCEPPVNFLYNCENIVNYLLKIARFIFLHFVFLGKIY